MEKLVKKGDLFTYVDHYNNGKAYDVYSKLAYIYDPKLNKSYDEYKIITGLGDRNTKVLLFLKPICDSKLNILKEGLLKQKNEYGLISLDPHNVFHINIDFEINEINKRIDFENKKKSFFEKNRSVDYKIDLLLASI